MKPTNSKLWKLWALLSLPIPLVVLLPSLLPAPTRELRRQIEGTWRSAHKKEVLTLEWGSAGYSLQLMQGARDKYGEVGLYGGFHLVDNSHIRIRSWSKWMPEKLIRVRFKNNGGEMLLDPSDGKDAAQVTKWIRVKEE